MEPHNGEAYDLPPPPPLSGGDEPLKADETKKLWKPKRSLAPRNGFAKKGQQIRLVTNHFKVSLKNTEEFFYHYYVNLKYEDDTPVDHKGAGRKVMDKLQQIYATELANKDFAYDGEKGLFTISALPPVNNEFIVVVEDFAIGKLNGVSIRFGTLFLQLLIRDRDIEKWAVGNFSARCNVRNLVQDLVNCGGMKSTKVLQTFVVFDENPSLRRAPAVQRVEEMFEQVKTKLPGAPKFILCVLARKKDSDVYGP